MAWHHHPPRADEAALLERYAPLAGKVALRFCRNHAVGRSLYAEARQAALLGLLEAVRTHDPARGASLLTHCWNVTRARMIDHLRLWHLVPRSDRAGARPLPTVPLDAPPPGRLLAPGQCLAAPGEPPGHDLEVADEVRRHLGRLSPRSRRLVELYYLEGRTMVEVGRALRLSESRVSQLHAGVLAFLRTNRPGERRQKSWRQRKRRPATSAASTEGRGGS